MAGGKSFRVDLDQVEAAAKMIENMLDDLERPTADLVSVVEGIQPTVYGTDTLGKSMTGATASVGGLGEHQKQVLDGIKQFIANSTQVAANLRQMVQSYRAVDEENMTALQTIEGVDAPLPTAQNRSEGPVVVIAPALPDAATPPPPAADSFEGTTTAPTLDYNFWQDPEAPPSA
ncbi:MULTISPECIES: hypothetical protein [unclassified Kitasatospora]|uniref:hypothetical protein n=1 Tax=unclassified Kitasatospora TaxID=2633591 RepID=UPI0012F9F720|nr:MULTISPECIES: hypothetical protein [unclassified Kitasatospora]